MQNVYKCDIIHIIVEEDAEKWVYEKNGAYHFHNSDADTVFDMSRSIYEEDYGKINTVYKERKISPELGMVIGAITESQKLIDHAVESEEKGGKGWICVMLWKN